MPLFSFFKKAGADTLKKNTATKAPAETKVVFDEAADRAATINSLRAQVQLMGLDIKNFDLQLDDDKITVYGQVDSQAIKEKIVLTLGNTDGIASVDDRISVVNPEPEAEFYEVKSGDTLSKIAKEHYGDPSKYNDIFEANTPMLKDPNKIYPGQKLRIPQAQ